VIRRAFHYIALYILLAVALPIAAATGLTLAKGWPANWRVADWSSSRLLPDARDVAEAKVVILATRTGRWKSIFAEHMSIVMKPEGAAEWTRYDVVGWGRPVRRNAYAADAFWFGNRPCVVAEISGAQAAALIPSIEANIARYPYARRGDYVVWPGPNSNSFVAWVVRNTEGFNVALPPAAVGKDYLGDGVRMARAASGTGFVASVSGVLGVTVAWREGFEVNLLGAAIGSDPDDLAISLPGLGKVGLRE
jgi:hypothetical protein